MEMQPPDLGRFLGFTPRCNPDPDQARRRERAWQERHGIIDDVKMCKRFQHYEPGKMVACGFPDARGAHTTPRSM